MMLKDERFDRFKHNLSLEYTIWDLFGRKHYGGMAGGFRDASYCREALLKAVSRIRNRFSEIPMDERLTQNVGSILDTLEASAKEISEDKNTDWDIITNLLHLVVHLIGYDQLEWESSQKCGFLAESRTRARRLEISSRSARVL